MYKFISIIVLGFFCAPITLAQPVLTPKNLALGGGGSTYITDFNANFYNPANLLINDRSRTIDLGFLSGGTFFNGVLNFENPWTQKDNYFDHFNEYSAGQYNITANDRMDIIDTHYNRERLTSEHQSRFEITAFGVKWGKNDKAYSFAARTRVGSTFETGRNWYSDQEVIDNTGTFSNQNLIHRYQVLHEFSFGYSESIGLLNGLSSRLDKFMIGIAPKFILAGPYQNADWKNSYTQNSSSTDINRSQSFEYQSAGNISAATLDYLNGSSADQATTQNLEPLKDELMNIHGFGVGLDVGVTYLLTFGSDLSTLDSDRHLTKRSLRISFSINDIGFVNYNDKTTMLEEVKQSSVASNFPNTADQAFVGAPGQFLNFVDQYGDGNPFAENNAEFADNSFSTLLPTSFNGGVLLELNRIKLMGDMSIGISKNAFNNTKLTTSLGAELRPLNFLPLRGGLQFTPGLPGSFNVGTAIETKFWDLSLAMLVSARSFTTATHLSGAGLAVLQFHL
ncbi:MAG: DUF5723 family protein [Balneola sp.]